jgi:hypothetical protein
VSQAFRIHRETYDLNWNPLRKPETVHRIASLTAWQANPADILAGNRGHWQVENREHYVRDRTFDEDRSQVRTKASPQFLATARNTAISLMRLAGCVNIARGLDYLSRRLGYVLTLLGVLPESSQKEVTRTRGLCRWPWQLHGFSYVPSWSSCRALAALRRIRLGARSARSTPTNRYSPLPTRASMPSALPSVSRKIPSPA